LLGIKGNPREFHFAVPFWFTPGRKRLYFLPGFQHNEYISSHRSYKNQPVPFSISRIEIEKTIDEYLKGKFKDKTEINVLKGQLGDLNRKHLINRLLQLSKHFRVPIRQLWPKRKDPKDGFREILSSRRADLLHRGIVRDGDCYHGT
jgi:hypothetical protein